MNESIRGFFRKMEAWFTRPPHALLLLVWLSLIAMAFTVPVDRKGDGSEYILATESLYYDADLVIDNKVDLFRHFMQRPEAMDTPAGLTRIAGTDGAEHYGLHSFYYPLFALPFYAAFGYSGFYVLNAVFVGVMITSVYGFFARTHPERVALGFAVLATFFSAAWSYVFWTQAETMYPALLAVFFNQWFAGRPLRATAAAGVVFAAQPALGLFAVPMFAELLRRRAFSRAALCGAVLAAWMIPQFAYNVLVLGTLLPMSKVGLASADNVSGPLFVRLLFDPSMGFLWFYPAAAYCLVQMRSTFRTVSLLVVSLVVLFAMTSVHTFYSHQVGSRYANWIFPAFLFLAGNLSLVTWASRLAAAFAVVVGTGLAINPVGNSRDMDVRHKTFLPYRVATALGLETDNPEVFRYGSDPLVADAVYLRRVTRDHWTWGGARAELMLLDVHPGELALDVQAWPRPNERQHLTLSTKGGHREEYLLESGKSTHVVFPLRPGDVEYYPRWKMPYAYVYVAADPWSPSIELQGDRPEAHDLRRLGVLLERITNGARVLYDDQVNR